MVASFTRLNIALVKKTLAFNVTHVWAMDSIRNIVFKNWSDIVYKDSAKSRDIKRAKKTFNQRRPPLESLCSAIQAGFKVS